MGARRNYKLARAGIHASVRIRERGDDQTADLVLHLAEELQSMQGEAESSARFARTQAAENNRDWRKVAAAIQAGDLREVKKIATRRVQFPEGGEA